NINLDNFRNWLIQTTKNYCGTHLQQLSKTIPHSLISMPLAEQWSHQLTQPEEQIMLQCVTKAFKTLVPAQQECIRLFYLEKMNIEGIARSTGFSLTDVRAHIRIGKQIIRNLLNHNTN